MISKRKENQIKPVGIVIQIIFENQSEKTCFPRKKQRKLESKSYQIENYSLI